MTKYPAVCEWCGHPLDEDEMESPLHSKDSKIICDECYRNEYTHSCPLCEESFSEDFFQKISPQYLLVSEYASEGTSTPTGIYKITEYPFYADGVTEAHLIETSLQHVSDIPKGFNEGEHFGDIFYVCDNCMQRILTNKDK
jgi:hypothetical protein